MVTSSSSEAPNYPRASLYVGDLHPNVTETMLFDKFACAGPIHSIHVCRDIITRRSLGYAYVNYQIQADAERAFDMLSFDLFRGRPLNIKWPQSDSTSVKSDVGNIFIKNLHKNIDTKSLYDIFSAFGNILSCKVMTDANGQSKGFGFVHFETKEAADDAINTVNGMLLRDKKVCVGRFTFQNRCVDADKPQKFTSVFVKNFGDQFDENKLCELFSKYGKVTDCKIESDENGHSKGCGFLSFEYPEEAEEAIKNLNGYSINDKQLYVVHFPNKTEHQTQEQINKYQGVNVYIENLDHTIDNQRLKKEFSKFGTIISAKVMTENGRSKGIGFVSFSAPDEAARAITEMNGTILGSGRLYVAFAQRKEEHQMYSTNQNIATFYMPLQIQLPFPNTIGGMVSYLPTLIPIYQPTLCWPSTATIGGTRPQMIVNAQPQQKTNIQKSRVDRSTIVTTQEQLTLASLANATSQEQKQMLKKLLL